MENKIRIKNSWIFRGCSVGILLLYSQRIKEMALKNELFEKIEGDLYVMVDEAVNILFHLTRVFVCFREEDKYFPRKNGGTFKSFTIGQTFDHQNIKKVKQGVVYIADNVVKMLPVVKKREQFELHPN